MTHFLQLILSDLTVVAGVTLTLRLLGTRVRLEDTKPVWKWRPRRRDRAGLVESLCERIADLEARILELEEDGR